MSKKYPLVYAAWDKNKKNRIKASSGGIAGKIINWAIEVGYIVFAPSFDDGFSLSYKRFDKKSNEYIGTKYFQSKLNNCFADIKQLLLDGHKILFVGTPCYVDGLKRLVNDNKNIIYIDLICSGVPSELVFKKYIYELENKYSSKVIDFRFKYKKPGWVNYSMYAEFENGMKYIKDAAEDKYMNWMLKYGVSVRPSCYKCKYTNIDRIGDITLGDFWGFRSHSLLYLDNNKGISLCLANNNFGNEILNSIQDIYCEQRSISEAIKGNFRLRDCMKEPQNRKKFWNMILNQYDLIDTIFPPDKLSFVEKIKHRNLYVVLKNIFHVFKK